MKIVFNNSEVAAGFIPQCCLHIFNRHKYIHITQYKEDRPSSWWREDCSLWTLVNSRRRLDVWEIVKILNSICWNHNEDRPNSRWREDCSLWTLVNSRRRLDVWEIVKILNSICWNHNEDRPNSRWREDCSLWTLVNSRRRLDVWEIVKMFIRSWKLRNKVKYSKQMAYVICNVALNRIE